MPGTQDWGASKCLLPVTEEARRRRLRALAPLLPFLRWAELWGLFFVCLFHKVLDHHLF